MAYPHDETGATAPAIWARVLATLRDRGEVTEATVREELDAILAEPETDDEALDREIDIDLLTREILYAAEPPNPPLTDEQRAIARRVAREHAHQPGRNWPRDKSRETDMPIPY